MAVKLDPEQQHTLQGILAVARKVRAPSKDILSAVETALVEANLHNPRSASASGAGSGSSVGWRQETASSYSNVNRANVHGAAKRFFAELQKAPGGSAGKRAQAVQRSAYPGRYDQAEGQAKAIIRQYAGKAPRGGKGSVRTVTTSVPGAVVSGSPNPVTAIDPSGLSSLLSSQLSQDNPVQALQPAPIQLPNFSARYDLRTPSGTVPSLPESGPLTSTSSSSVDQALQALQQLGVDASDLNPLGSSGSVRLPGSSATSKSVSGASGGSGGAVTGRKGTARFQGKQVAGWIEPILRYAKAHGWKGSVESGYRSRAEQTRIYNSGVRPAAKPGTSNHEGTDFPRGAVDVTEAQQLSQIIARSPYRKLLKWAGGKDPPHFSHPHGGSY